MNISKRILLFIVCVCVDYILIPLLVFFTDIEMDLKQGE